MKKLINIILGINILLSFYYIYLHFSPLDISKILLGIVSIILIIVPFIYEKIKNKKIEEYIKLIYYFFLLFAFVLGLLFEFYYITLYFDLFVHGIFGFLLSIIIGKKIKIDSLKRVILLLSIIIFLGFIWETLEFLSDLIFNTDHQEKINGSQDTMTDMLISTLGVVVYLFMNKIKR